MDMSKQTPFYSLDDFVNGTPCFVTCRCRLSAIGGTHFIIQMCGVKINSHTGDPHKSKKVRREEENVVFLVI